MRTIITSLLGLALILTVSPTLAQPGHKRPKIAKIIYQVSAQQWVKTQSAKVTIQINATLGNKGLSQVRSDIMNNLNRIGEGEWHITVFNRSQDRSGLERLNVSAQARLNESKLANLRTMARKVSQPGAKYRVQAIDFTPSLAEMQQAKTELRKKLYDKIKAEMATANATYPAQKYQVYRINFLRFAATAAPRAYKANRMMAMADTARESSAQITVSNRLTLTATVMLAAKA
jgi:hypothetical protein